MCCGRRGQCTSLKPSSCCPLRLQPARSQTIPFVMPASKTCVNSGNFVARLLCGAGCVRRRANTRSAWPQASSTAIPNSKCRASCRQSWPCVGLWRRTMLRQPRMPSSGAAIDHPPPRRLPRTWRRHPLHALLRLPLGSPACAGGVSETLWPASVPLMCPRDGLGCSSRARCGGFGRGQALLAELPAPGDNT